MKSDPNIELTGSLLAGGPAGIQAALEREMLYTEQRRAMAFAGVLVLSYLALFAPLAIPGAASPEIRHHLKGALPAGSALTIAAAAYEVGAWFLARRLLRAGRRIPPPVPYVKAFIESSVAAAAILISARAIGPLEALQGSTPLLYFIFILMTTLQLDWRVCCFSGVVAAAQYMAIAARFVRMGATPHGAEFAAEPAHHIAKASLYLVTGVVAGFVASQLRQQLLRSVRSYEERDHIVDLFGQHVSPQVVEMLLAQRVELGSETRYVCVMFLDIRDFTRFAEEQGPQSVMEYLNTLFGALIEIVNQNRGIVNKFLGDGFMAVFGAPIADGEDRRHAVTAALQIVEKVRQMNDSAQIPATRLGIGLHAGAAVTGHVGSAQRKEYTVIGSVVNAASRIEQANKQFGSSVLISAEVWSALEHPPEGAVSLGSIALRGQAPLDLYQLA